MCIYMCVFGPGVAGGGVTAHFRATPPFSAAALALPDRPSVKHLLLSPTLLQHLIWCDYVTWPAFVRDSWSLCVCVSVFKGGVGWTVLAEDMHAGHAPSLSVNVNWSRGGDMTRCYWSDVTGSRRSINEVIPAVQPDPQELLEYAGIPQTPAHWITANTCMAT